MRDRRRERRLVMMGGVQGQLETDGKDVQAESTRRLDAAQSDLQVLPKPPKPPPSTE